MGKPKKKGAYEHFCVIIFAQGKWNDKDRASIRKSLIEKHNMCSDNPYPLFTKLTYREKKPSYSDCNLCGPIYEMFQEISGTNDNIIYQGHHYLLPEDDKEDMKELTKIILGNPKVKKFYLLYLDSFGEVDRNVIKKWTLNDLKERLTSKLSNSSEFETLVDENKFKSRIIFEISKF